VFRDRRLPSAPPDLLVQRWLPYQVIAAVLAVAFFAAHLPWLPRTLEDLDSVNFALAIADFDPVAHQPHPPGYPLFVGVAKLSTAFVSATSDLPPVQAKARALGLLAAAGGALAVLPLFWLLLLLGRVTAPAAPRVHARQALLATALTVAAPLYWFTAGRPMSDVPGLAVALAAQALLVAAWVHGPGAARAGQGWWVVRRTEAMGLAGAFVGAAAMGFRVQTALLVVPALALVVFDQRRSTARIVRLVGLFTIFFAGWATLVFAESGGIGRYLRAIQWQAGDDLAGVEMLATSFSPRLLALALWRTLVLPWCEPVLGAIVLGAAGAGLVALALRAPRALALLAILAGPYAAFHLLFQDTLTTRYALPLVPMVAWLAAHGLRTVLRRHAALAIVPIAAWSLAIGAMELEAYARHGAPAMVAFGDLADATEVEGERLVAMHHRIAEETRRAWSPAVQARSLAIDRLEARVGYEWLQPVHYFAGGGTEPVWFLADPRRTDLALIDGAAAQLRGSYRWPVRYPAALVGGARPSVMDWYEFGPPGWMLERGWALTPETGGMSEADGVTPALGPVTGFVRRRSEPAVLMIGGRHLGTADAGAAHLAVTIDGSEVLRTRVEPGPFLEFAAVPAATYRGASGYARLEVHTTPVAGSGAAPVVLEQFDLQSVGTEPILGYGAGWHEPEYDARSGRLFRWTEAAAHLHVTSWGLPIALQLNGDSPLKYVDIAPRIVVRAGDVQLTGITPSDAFTITVSIDPLVLERAGGRISIETDRTFSPSERSATPDRRRLGLRIFGARLEQPALTSYGPR
jgi:hypothetical protein